MKQERFDDFLTERNDAIDNAFFNALKELSTTALEWDMGMIGDLIDCAESIIRKHGFESCYPYYECDDDDDVPCPEGEDCQNKNCPYRKTHAWRFNGKVLDPAKLPTKDEVVSGIHALGGEGADRAAILNRDYGEYGTDVAYWHSFDPEDKVGCVLMPVREGMLCVPFGSWFQGEPKDIHLLGIEIISVEDCWCIQDNCYNTDAKPGAAKIWEEAATISLAMGNHDHEDDLCK